MISATAGAGTIAQLYDDLSQIAKSEHPATLNYGRYFSGYTNDGSDRLAIAILDQQSYNAFGKNGFIIYKNGSVASSSDTTSAFIGQLIWFTD